MILRLALIALLVAPAANAASVADLTWMTGSWMQAEQGHVVRETWLPAMGEQMVGVGQDVRAGRRANYEFERIEAKDGVLVLTAVLEGQPPTDFTMIPAGPGEAVFENKAHDFPQRVIYRRCGEDLCARIEGVINGQARAEDWRYHREH